MEISRFILKVFLAAFAFIRLSSALAASNFHEERFESWMKELEPALGRAFDARQAADKLIAASKARIAAFNLQALGRLYASIDIEEAAETFKAFGKAAKNLEDGIGGVDKWVTIRKKAEERGASATELGRLDREIRTATDDLVKSLRTDGWVSPGAGGQRFRDFQNFLAGHEWPSAAEDRKQMLKRLRKTIAKPVEEDFDLTVLEEGNGLHEFRRAIRWFLIEARVLNGLVTYRSNPRDCPVPGLLPLLNTSQADSKYTELPPSRFPQVKTGALSECLVLSMADTVGRIGKVKDQIEADVNIGGHSDKVPVRYRKAAQDIYDQFKRRGGGPELVGQLEACEKN